MNRLLPLLALSACLAPTVARIDGTRLPTATNPSLYFVLPVAPPTSKVVVPSRGPHPASSAKKCWCDRPQLTCEVKGGEVHAVWRLHEPDDLPIEGGRTAACTDGTSSWWARVVHTRPPPDPWWRSERALIVPTRREEPSRQVILAPEWLPLEARVAPPAEDGQLQCRLLDNPRAIEIEIGAPIAASRDGEPCLIWHGGEVRAYPLVWFPLDGSELP
jgi:hypothetical protein